MKRHITYYFSKTAREWELIEFWYLKGRKEALAEVVIKQKTKNQDVVFKNHGSTKDKYKKLDKGKKKK
jgi:hypothetical protein